MKTQNGVAYRWYPADIAQLLQGFGLEPKRGQSRPDARALAVTRIGPDIAQAQTAQTLNERTGGCIFYQRTNNRVSGLLGFIPLRPEGLAALEADTFNGVNPPLPFVAEPGDPLACVYGWVFVGSTMRAAAAVVSGLMVLRDRHPAIPFYARAATEDGLRVLTGRMGYAPVASSCTGLLCSASLTRELEVAA